MLDLLRDGEARENLVRLGRTRARDFRWQDVVCQYEQLYAEAIAETRPRSNLGRQAQ